MPKLMLAALAIVLSAACLGCNTEGDVVAPEREEVSEYAVQPGHSVEIRWVEVEGKTVKALVEVDKSGPSLAWYRIIMILDYPCGAIGPLPQGHGRDCTDDPNGTPSDEPDVWKGDPTSDD